MLLHRNVVANVAQIEAWMRPFVKAEAQHVIVTALPLYHISALTGCCLFACRIGALQILIANPRDIPGFIKTLKTRPFTGCFWREHALQRARQPPQIGRSTSQTRLLRAGGMATQAAVGNAGRR